MVRFVMFPEVPSDFIRVDLTMQAGTAPDLPPTDATHSPISFPVLGPSRVAAPDCDGASAGVDQPDEIAGAASSLLAAASLADIEAAGLCTREAPAIVFGVKLQPVLAIDDGVVTDVRDEPGSGTPIQVTITDADGISATYAGFNDDNPGTDDGAAPDHLRLTPLAEIGNVVRAGQVIGFLGDTDPLPTGVRADVPTDSTVTIDPDAVAPHIRITLRDLDGRALDAYGPLLDATLRETCRVGIGRWSQPGLVGSDDPDAPGAVVIETTDVHREIDSDWVIHPDSSVSATGWAAMINPSENCDFVPATAHGVAGAGSSAALSHWAEPIELPSEIWVTVALQADAESPDGFLRPF